MVPLSLVPQESAFQISKPQNEQNKSLSSSALTDSGEFGGKERESKEGSHEASGKRKREQEVTRNSVKTRPLRRSVRGRFNLSDSM